MFRWRERQAGNGSAHGVEWAVTDRHGGVSREPWSGLNLGARVDDQPEDVRENRRRLAGALDLSECDVRYLDQVHGCAVAEVGPDVSDPAEPPVADAQVTACTDVALAVLVADCTPVLLLDRRAGLVGAVHAGRPGMMAGVVPAAVDRLRGMGAADLEAVVGPSVCPRCYEVPEELRAAAGEANPCAPSVSWTGTPAIDVAAAVVDQLRGAGVAVRWLPGCSRESPDLYSHRRDGRTGRYAGVVRLLPPGEKST